MRKATKSKKKKVVAAIVAALLAAFIWSPFSNYGISLAVMKVYSGIHERDSVMAKAGMDIEIPGGGETREKDWYPFVITYNPGEAFEKYAAGRHAGDDVELSIMYNFPAFDLVKGCSQLYNPSSPYYTSFYGAYAVKGKDGDGNPYGFDENGKLNLGLTAVVPEFDFKHLVLSDLGLDYEDMVFDWEIADFEEGVEYAGSGGWTMVDADLTVNGTYHHKEKFRRSYLQYGVPADFGAGYEDFEQVSMKGRVYGKYFDDCGVGVFFYIMASDEDVLKACDEEILGKSHISMRG